MAQRSEPALQTFLIADLSGFTALTETHGDEQATASGVALLPAGATRRNRR